MERNEAAALFKEYNEEESLFKHALSVEAAMRYFAEKNNEDKEEWGLAGLLHDIDYGKYPDMHCVKAREILEKAGVPEKIIRAVESHGYGICTDVKPESVMEKTLYAVDELAGFITACALVRPSKSLSDMEVKSVKKKLKDKGFAAKVDREIIKRGAEMLEMPLDDLIKETVNALIPIQEKIGLKNL